MNEAVQTMFQSCLFSIGIAKMFAIANHNIENITSRFMAIVCFGFCLGHLTNSKYLSFCSPTATTPSAVTGAARSSSCKPLVCGRLALPSHHRRTTATAVRNPIVRQLLWGFSRGAAVLGPVCRAIISSCCKPLRPPEVPNCVCAASDIHCDLWSRAVWFRAYCAATVKTWLCVSAN